MRLQPVVTSVAIQARIHPAIARGAIRDRMARTP